MMRAKDKGKGRYQIGWYRATNAWLGHTNDVGRRRRDEIRMGRAYGRRLVEDVLIMERIEKVLCIDCDHNLGSQIVNNAEDHIKHEHDVEL